MADDSVTLNDANDAPFKVAVDTVGQRDFQVVKLAVGAEDTAVYVSAAQGPADPGTVRVVAASDDPGVAAAQTANTLLTNIDGHIDGVEALLTAGNTTTAGLATVRATATAPTYTEGQTPAPISVTTAGDTRVVAKQSGAWTVALPTDASTATNQATMIGHVDGIETLLTTIDGRVDGLETLVTATNTALGLANTSLDAIEAAAADTTTPLPVKGQAPITRLTPTILTSAYTTGTVLFATTSIANLVPANDQPVVLESLFVVDKDDEGVAITLHFFSANVALGTAGSAPSITDADAASAWLGWVDIATGDYKDLGGVKVASLKGIGLNLAPASGTRNVYVAATVTGTPTFAATSDLVFGFGVLG